MSKKNLLKETKEKLRENEKTPSDVRFVALKDEQHFSWSQFEEIADVRYNSGFGGENINKSLIVVGDDWWLERDTYDGAEGWDFKTLPEKPETQSRPHTVSSKYGSVYDKGEKDE